ncbi:MAG: hypothetical protein QHI48_05715 [Bacteroidota bacterium]|nr:hypothetical protein [Bacteroidota bacterium]
MIDHIEELIVAYLHRGLSQEQERELFDACRNNPDVATLLRQHVVLSLKLRAVRDRTEVPLETRNELIERINALPVPQETAPVGPRRRYTPMHLFGGMFATAAVTACVVFLLLPIRGTPPASPVAMVHDTVAVTLRDTVTVVRTVRIDARRSAAETVSPAAVESGNLAVSGDVSKDSRTAETGGDEPILVKETDDDLNIVDVADVAEARRTSGPSWIQQYNVMLSRLETVKISSNDRILH